MKLSIHNQKDFAAGLIYLAAGTGFAIGALNYKLGDPARMGPGWFPFWVGVLLALLGLAVAVKAVRPGATREVLQRLELRSMAWILGSVVLFGLLLQPLGLVISLAVLVIVSSLGSHEFGWKGALLNAALLIAFSVGVFIKGINLQIGLWPAFLG
jgi:hypothetical protein